MSWSIKLTGEAKALEIAIDKPHEFEPRVRDFIKDAIRALWARRIPTSGNPQYQSAVAPYPNGMIVESHGLWNDDCIEVHLTITRQKLELDKDQS